MPPVVRLSMASRGSLPDELSHSVRRAANWGCWLRTFAVGPATYDSRACYNAKPILGLRLDIHPWYCLSKSKTIPMVTMNEVLL